MKLLEQICRQPATVAFGLRRGGRGEGAGGEMALSVTRAADSVSLVTAAGAAALGAATPSVAGVLPAADKAKLDTLTSALATPASDGLMSGADKAKLDALGQGEPGAGGMSAATYDPQGIAGDAFDRANHTGEQAISTIGGLQAALDDKAGQLHAHSALDITSGRLKHERGGLQADVSTFDGLVKISGGATSQAVPGQDYATGAQGVLADGAVQPGDQATSLGGTAHRLLHVDGAGSVAELGYGAPGTFLRSEGPAAPPSWGTPQPSGPSLEPADGLELSDGALRMTANQRTTAVEFVIDGGGSPIASGLKGFLQVPMDCTIKAARLLADQPGSIVVDVWKQSFANHPPSDADSITGATPPSIDAAVKSDDATLAGWTTGIAAGDVLGFHVDSASAVASVTVVLVVTVS